MAIKEAKHLNELEEMLQLVAVKSVWATHNALTAYGRLVGKDPVAEIAAILDWHDNLVEEAMTALKQTGFIKPTKGRYPMD